MVYRKILVCMTALTFFLFVNRANAMCYSIYRGDSLVFQSMSVPVDMGLPMSQTVPAKFGVGATMMFNDGPCTEVAASGASGTSPEKSAGSTRRTSASRSSGDQTVSFDKSQNEVQGARNPDVINNLSQKYGSFTSDSTQAGYAGQIQTGPRGGQFYINSNGNKTYIGSAGSAKSGRR